MATAVLFVSVLTVLFVSLLYEPRSHMWWVLISSVVSFDAFALGFAAVLSSRRWGWAGLWGYWVDRNFDGVVSAVRRGLAAAGFTVVPTLRRPARPLLGKAPLPLEMPCGAVIWIARPVGRGQLFGPVTRVAIEDGERMPPEELERVKATIANALPTRQGA
jgi:hypothetical protein